MDVPAFMLIPAPHEDDAEYCRNMNENWWPPASAFGANDLGGPLHEQFYKPEREAR